MQWLAIGALVVATCSWGFTFILVKWTVATVNVYYFLFLRFALAFLLMVLVFPRQTARPPQGTLRAAFILSLFLAAAYITQTVGLRWTTAANSSLITGLFIVLIPLFLFAFWKTRIRLGSLAGIALAIAGLFLLTHYNFVGANFGDAITLLCAVVCAFHVILTGRYGRAHRLIPLVMYQFLFTALWCGIFLPWQWPFAWNLPPIGWWSLVIGAVLANVLAFLLQTWAQRRLDATRTGLVLTMEPLFGTLFAIWLGHETFTQTGWIGAALMIVGVVVSEISSA